MCSKLENIKELIILIKLLPTYVIYIYIYRLVGPSCCWSHAAVKHESNKTNAKPGPTLWAAWRPRPWRWWSQDVGGSDPWRSRGCSGGQPWLASLSPAWRWSCRCHDLQAAQGAQCPQNIHNSPDIHNSPQASTITHQNSHRTSTIAPNIHNSPVMWAGASDSATSCVERLFQVHTHTPEHASL